MTFTVRPAHPEDVASIVPWTTETFSWGDYVPERLPAWIEDPDSEVIVCADERDVPIAVSRAAMLSPVEGWLEGARVHPDHLRSGMGSAMNIAGVEWARQRGARVVRLATESDNIAARGQVASLGYRHTSSWVYAELKTGGIPRSPPELRLRPSPTSDVDAAWMFWSASDLAHQGRGLLADGWQWRKARPDDLIEAARTSRLHQSAAGWVIADQPEPDWMLTRWVATTPEDAPRLVDGILEFAGEQEAGDLTIKMPSLPWTMETLNRAGGDPKEVLIYSLGL